MGVKQLALCTIISAVFWCFLATCDASPRGKLELKMVQVVFRHGNRTPDAPYYNDPNANETFSPYGWNKLDRAGRQSAYGLGQYLRNLYGDFVGNEYIPGEVNIFSTDVDRTKMCAQLVAAGMFPPSSTQKWGLENGLGQDWQPITFDFIPTKQDDFLLMVEAPCPAYWKERRKATTTPEVAAVLENDLELLDALARNAHVEPNVHDIEMFHQTLRSEDFHHLIVPDWVKPFYPDRLVAIGKMHFKAVAYTRKMQRLWGGPLLKHLIEQMELHKRGSGPKLWLYSGHDQTISTLGMTMRVWGDMYPDFSNAIILELYSDQAGDLFVKTLFHNDTSKLPQPLTVEGCEELCHLTELKFLLDDVIPRNQKAECRVVIASDSSMNHPTAILLVAAFFLLRLFSLG